MALFQPAYQCPQSLWPAADYDITFVALEQQDRVSGNPGNVEAVRAVPAEGRFLPLNSVVGHGSCSSQFS